MRQYFKVSLFSVITSFFMCFSFGLMEQEQVQQIGLTNANGEVVDIYIPRKCSITNNIIGPQDHASVQFRVAICDQDGVATGDYIQYAFCGKIRHLGHLDAQLTALAQKDKLIKAFDRK